MKKTLLMSLVLMLTLFQAALAQTRSLSGRVTDRQTGEGMPGVTVLLKGTTTGASTNADGTFSITTNSTSGTLVFSSVGYISQEQAIGSASQFTIALASDAKVLSEVVAVAYGTQSKALLTSSQATVAGGDFATQPISGLDQALQGRASGVLVTQNSGTPGGGIAVRIRGSNSITAGSEPLYVIDGVPINTGSYSNIGVGNQTLNALSDINPNDIESMEVLKDAAASSLYGSRAVNGVVLVTTKRGKAGHTQVSANYYTGTQQTINRLGVLSGQESQDLINEARVNVGLAPRYVAVNPTTAQALFTGASTNWQDEIFRSARISNYSATVSGGDAKTRFLLTGTFFDQDGIIIGSGFRRGNGRFNLDHEISGKLRVGTNLTVSRSLASRINNDNNINGVLSAAILLGPQTPVFNPDGTYGKDVFSSVENPVAAAVEPTFNARTGRMIGNTYLEYEPVQGLRIRTNFGIDYLTLKEDTFFPNTLNTAVAANGTANANNRSDVNWLNETTATYTRTFSEDHAVTLLVGGSYQKSVQEGIQATASNFPGNGLRTLIAGSVKTQASSDLTFWNLLSGFTRFNYGFRNKYLFQASVRRDGSSRFGINNRYGVFPSVSLAWRIGEEQFLKGNPTVSELKIRTSFGQTGNFEFPNNFAALPLFGVGVGNNANYLQQAGFSPTQLANPNLTWERSEEYNVGLDLGLFNNKVLLTANVFSRNSRDLLLNRPLQLTSGFFSIAENIGSLQNRGIELDLTTTNVNANGFKWTTKANVSVIRNKVTSLYENQPFLSGFANRVEVGQPLGNFYGFKVDKIFQTTDEINALNAEARLRTGVATAVYQAGAAPGDIKFQDLDGNGVISGADQAVLGSAQPNFFGGITNDVSYMGFDLGLFFQFQQGNRIYNSTRGFGEGMNSQFGQLAAVRNRWTPTNTDTDIPRAAWNDPNNNRRTSDRFLEDGSYMRLKTLTLGYSLPTATVQAMHIQSARIYLAGQNLLTFTRYTGLDPEVNTFSGVNTSLGTDFLTFPQARVYQVGINLGF